METGDFGFHLKFEPPVNTKTFFRRLVTPDMLLGEVDMQGSKHVRAVTVAGHYVSDPERRIGRLLSSQIEGSGYELAHPATRKTPSN
jgi:hypothetical protein